MIGPHNTCILNHYLSELEEPQWMWHGEYTSTDAKGNTNISLICTKCQSLLTTTHIFGGCRFTAKLRIKRHDSTFRLLLQLLQNSNGGRRPILCADLGHKPVTDFSILTVDIGTSSHTHHQGITRSLQEGLQDDKSETPDYPQPIPDYVLHPQHKPKHHKSDLIRSVGYTLNTQGN